MDRLERRLPRMPFPPLTKDAVFDHESVLNEHVRLYPQDRSLLISRLIDLQRVLETQLSTTRNTIDLLKLEIEREEALLSKETKYVEEMEKNAKKAEVERRRQMKNVRPPWICIGKREVLNICGIGTPRSTTYR